jgi:hypothetical protein
MKSGAKSDAGSGLHGGRGAAADGGRRPGARDLVAGMTGGTFYYHGGVDGLRPGDLLLPGHARKSHDGCPWCAAREAGGAHLGMDGPSELPAVYFSTVRLYAKYHASLYGRGDLYRVEPVGDVVRSLEDSLETFAAPSARVLSVYDRAVLLTNTERRKLSRLWEAADNEMKRAGLWPAKH